MKTFLFRPKSFTISEIGSTVILPFPTTIIITAFYSIKVHFTVVESHFKKSHFIKKQAKQFLPLPIRLSKIVFVFKYLHF